VITEGNPSQGVRELAQQAVAVLMDRHGLTEKDAFAFVAHAAMDRRVTVRVVASEILEGTLTP